MADEAARTLGAPTIAGTFANPKGMQGDDRDGARGQIGGFAGALVGGAVADRTSGAARTVPDSRRVGYLAVTDTKVALLGTRTGAFKMKISDTVLARAPRAEVTSADFDQGVLLSHLTMAFLDGAGWQFDVPRQDKKPARAVARALGGTAD